MRPTPDGMALCNEAEGFAPVNLEVDISAPRRDAWVISAVRMTIEDQVKDADGHPILNAKGHRVYRTRYEALSGALLAHAIAWLDENRDYDLVHHVQVRYLETMLGSYADSRREMA